MNIVVLSGLEEVTHVETRDQLPELRKAPHVRLNEDLVAELKRSYYDDTDIEVWAGDDGTCRELIREARIFARRTRTSFRYRFGRRDGRDYLVFSLKPRRDYVKVDTDYWENR